MELWDVTPRAFHAARSSYGSSVIPHGKPSPATSGGCCSLGIARLETCTTKECPGKAQPLQLSRELEIPDTRTQDTVSAWRSTNPAHLLACQQGKKC